MDIKQIFEGIFNPVQSDKDLLQWLDKGIEEFMEKEDNKEGEKNERN